MKICAVALEVGKEGDELNESGSKIWNSYPWSIQKNRICSYFSSFCPQSETESGFFPFLTYVLRDEQKKRIQSPDYCCVLEIPRFVVQLSQSRKSQQFIWFYLRKSSAWHVSLISGLNNQKARNHAYKLPKIKT